LVVHEDNITAGFGAEVAAVVVDEGFWYLDAPVRRLAPKDVPMPYHPALLETALQDGTQIELNIHQLLTV
jgi:2-oxoisovalerate dehydrogenase E1 component